MLAPMPAPSTASTSDDQLTHIYCCNPDLGLCGTDLSDTPEVDEDGILCVVCEDLEEEPCTCQPMETIR